MELGLEGRCALVGASSEGCSFETARALAAEGARVMLTGRDAGKLESARKAIGDAASTRVADLSSVAGAEAVVEQTLAELGRIDILIASVGGPPPGPAHATDLAELQRALDRCLMAMVALCQGVLPGMRERGWGRILAITSGGVRQPLSNMVYSNASRAGLTGYLKTLSREVIADGVTVNSILPGNILTRRLEDLVGDGLDAYAASLPAGRCGTAADFGTIAAFLCSEPANYLTGVALPIDGGQGGSLI